MPPVGGYAGVRVGGLGAGSDVSDRDGAILLLELYRARYPQLAKPWDDSHYGGSLQAEVREQYAIDIEVVMRAPEQSGFIPLPNRWIVERTLAWGTHCRRRARDYEREPAYQ